MSYSAIETASSLNIEGIEETIIYHYFETINRENFTHTATLFAEDGKLLAPFEKPIVGREAISLYLAKEAKGMKLLPNRGTFESTEDRLSQIKVVGKVKTPLFSVHVAWLFQLNLAREITQVRIKLLASPQELLKLQKVKTQK